MRWQAQRKGRADIAPLVIGLLLRVKAPNGNRSITDGHEGPGYAPAGTYIYSHVMIRQYGSHIPYRAEYFQKDAPE